MGRCGNRSAAAQMERDGIRTLPRWSRPACGIGASIQHRLDHGECGEAACVKEARYSTPAGDRCYDHAIAFRDRKAAMSTQETG